MSVTRREWAALDRFRLIAAVLVVCNHTSPLASYTEVGNFWLTCVLARVAVPFFFMVSGYFLARSGWNNTRRLLKKALLVYAAAVALYLPLNIYNGGYSLAEWPRKLLVDGTLYHLWYFPAVLLGVVLVQGLIKLGMPAAFTIAALLYLTGLGGDSYFGLAKQIPAAAWFYSSFFQAASYTRNGLFFAPLFLLLGAAGFRWSGKVSAVGFAVSLSAMTAEAFWLREMDWQRHTSMYLLLPACMVFLFSMLLGINYREDRHARRLSLSLYLLHPWSIVLVRYGAKLVKLERIFIENSLGDFSAVLALTFLLSLALERLRPMPLSAKTRAWKEVDLSALRHNARILQSQLAPGCELMAVVKADAYGHGAAAVTRHLQKAGIRAFAVACLSEGIALRKAGIRGTILISGYTPPAEAALLHRWRLTQTVAGLEHGYALAAQGTVSHVHLAIDTGMHRLGISVNDREALLPLYRLKKLKIEGMFSHLCVSDSLAPEKVAYTEAQLAAFYKVVNWLKERGIHPGKTHIQASYGILNFPPQPCDYARAGIALYGVYSDSTPILRRLDLTPALSLKAKVGTIQELRPGERAGYGLAFQAEAAARLAVITIGYADGLPRELAQCGGRVLIRGKSFPMVGRMCMDQLLVNVTGVEDVRTGDIVTLIGRDGDLDIRVEELAERCGTITNEILSRLGSRLAVLYNSEN